MSRDNEIEQDGYITVSNDIYDRLRAEANCDWARSIRCRDCRYAQPVGGITRVLYCLMHEKHTDPEQWCTYGVKE